MYRWTYAGNSTSCCFLTTQVVQREKRHHWPLVLLQNIWSLKSSLLQTKKCGEGSNTFVRHLSVASCLCPTVISAGEYLHALLLHSVRSWQCDQWSGLLEKCWEPLLLHKCLWVFYIPGGSVDAKKAHCTMQCMHLNSEKSGAYYRKTTLRAPFTGATLCSFC